MKLLRAIVSLSTIAGILLSVVGLLEVLNWGSPIGLGVGIALLLNALTWHVVNHIIDILTDIRTAVAPTRQANPDT